MIDAELSAAATRVVTALTLAGRTVATAESLTGGLVCAALTTVPGASKVVRGGVVVYATDLKATLGGVPATVLDSHGPVAAATASALAIGVRARLAADFGVATTGVAGPDGQDGHPPGTVFVALAGPDEVRVHAFSDDGGDARLDGDRDAIRAATVRAALELLHSGVEHLGGGESLR